MSELFGKRPATDEDVAILWKELKRAWNLLGEIEKGAHELRKSLPSDDPLRMRVLTLETMAGIGLMRKREAGRAILAKLRRLAAEDGFSLEEGDDGRAQTPAD